MTPQNKIQSSHSSYWGTWLPRRELLGSKPNVRRLAVGILVCVLTSSPAAVLRRQRGVNEEGLRALLWVSQRGSQLLQRPPEQRQALPGVCEGESFSQYYSSCTSMVPSIVWIRWDLVPILLIKYQQSASKVHSIVFIRLDMVPVSLIKYQYGSQYNIYKVRTGPSTTYQVPVWYPVWYQYGICLVAFLVS